MFSRCIAILVCSMLPMFAATVKGPYSVRLFINGAATPAASDEILVDVAAALA